MAQHNQKVSEQQVLQQLELHIDNDNTQAPVVETLPPSPLSTGFDTSNIMTRPSSQSQAAVSKHKEEYQRYIDDLLDWCGAQENLDVYQMNAFYAATHEMRYYWRNYWKTICVQFIQTFGLIILLYRDWTDILKTTIDESSGATVSPDEEESRGICNFTGPADLKLLAFFLISFLSIRLGDQIASIAEYGMYGWGDDVKYPHFINWGWVAYGLIINYVTLVASCFISAQVVYLSETPLDMILNFVALYFIIELDDEMVTWQDYHDIEDWIKGDESMQNDAADKSANAIGESPYETWLYNVVTGSQGAGVIDDDNDGYDDVKLAGRCGSKFNRCGMKVMKKGQKCRDPRIARNLMLPFIVGLPIYVFICY